MSKEIVKILVLVLVILFVWVGFEVFHRMQKTTLPEVVQEQITTFDPSLEADVFEDLKARQEYMVGEELPF